ncbi:cation transporter [Bdellovibrio bacteriovorus]|uniref:Cation transporter n=1 Tax=Bdellovibrio bacteriovorus TaxID=959 RepID=A0A150WRG6_BDEBC|nr:cation diffusion facilitator family transporter [Bdellovibrio bacteriovorus]KYG67030.1 cation transporter [Bdellovibrio bacteriovorus]
MAESIFNTTDRIRNRAAWISAIASILIFLLKVYAYRLTNSAAVLSDALESIVNVIAAGVALYVIRISSEPADENHPYGHGKAESFSSTFEGGLIFFAAVMIIAESIKALIYHEPAQKLELGLVFVGAAAILNLVLGLYLKNTGIKHQSEALRASGTHVLSDVVTTVGVMLGLGLVLLTGWEWIDPVVAILVGLQLAYSGYKIVRESLGVLMDEQNEEVLGNLARSLEKNRRPGIIDIHELRTIRSGRFHHVDAHLVVPEYWDVSRVHSLGNAFEADVVRDYEFDGELAFHIDPCKKSFCSVCSVPDCPIRQAPFQQERPFTVKSLTGGPQPTNP